MTKLCHGKGVTATESLLKVVEVLEAIAQAHGMTWDRSAAATKRSACGAFNDRVFLEFVENTD